MKTLILGFDALDPGRFESLSEEGKLPNLTRYAEAGGYARLTVATPPQTEVSWTSIATGLDPGGHGIFDFVHRNPASYTPYVSLLPTKRKLVGTHFTPPFKARTIFEEVANQGFPATALWWPASFPARPESLARIMPGLGTPDVQGRIGVGTLLSTDGELRKEKKTPVEVLNRLGKDRFGGLLRGPRSRKGGRARETTVELQLDMIGENSARLRVGKRTIELTWGMWSPIVEIPFKVGRFMSIRAITRFILTRLQPDVALYALPLQIHPLHTPWRYGNPRSFVKQTWTESGPFLTLGWPQDTTALEEECITDEQFLALCESVFHKRKQVLDYHLQGFREGILASVFDSLDRVQHMFWRDRPDIVDEWYVKMDDLVGDVEQRLAELDQPQTRLLVLSDHGFSKFNHKVHLNRWLIDGGYLSTQTEAGFGSLRDVDWSQSKAYAVGLNSLYLNLAGREGQGSLQPDQRKPLLDKLRQELLSWQGPDGCPVVKQVWRRHQVFSGSFAAYGPDLVIGYSPGYRASAETGLGRWEESRLEANHDHWGADHCIDSQAVPGVLFSKMDLGGYARPSYRDIPALAIDRELNQVDPTPPPPLSDEDQESIEERLAGLGYL